MRISKSITFTLIVLCVVCSQHKHIIPSFDFVKPKKIARIADAGYQEWLYAKNPSTNKVDRSQVIEAARKVRTSNSKQSLFWSSIGPNDVAGRIREILVDKNGTDGQKIWIGSASGGLWSCDDIYSVNATWKPSNDFFSSLSVCAIGQNPDKPNQMSFGTGEGYFKHDAFPGVGLYQSADAGKTWHRNPNAQGGGFRYIQDVIYIDEQTQLISTLDQGIQRTTDRGVSWSKVLGTSHGANVNSANKIIQLKDGTLYASMGLHEQGDIYKSTNNGATWSALNVNKLISDYHRIEIAATNADVNTICAIVEDPVSNGLKTIIKSNNKGATWTKLPLPNINGNQDFAGNQAWYNLSIAVSPENANHIIIGGIDLFISKNGGSSWEKISNWSGTGTLPKVHADQHAFAFTNSKDIIVANDGGIYLCTDVFENNRRFVAKNNQLNVTQCYDVVGHPNQDLIHLGTQDNGTQRIANFDLVDAEEITGGDGGHVYIDRLNPEIQLTSYIKNQYYVSTNGGEQFYYRSFNNEGLFINPSSYDENRKVLYAAHEKGKIFRWNNPAQLGVHTDEVIVNNIFNQQVTALKSSTHKADRLYIGTENGEVQRLEFAFIGTNRTGLSMLDLPDGHVIVDIEEDPVDADRIIVAVSNFGVVSLYETKDFGQNWQSIEGDLPDVPVRDVLLIKEQNNKVYIATEIGVFEAENPNGDQTQWTLVNQGMANVRVDKLSFHPHRKTIIAATFGRGIYEAQLNQTFSLRFEEQNQITVFEDQMVNDNDGCNDIYTYPIVIKSNRPADDAVPFQLTLEYANSSKADLYLPVKQGVFPANATEISIDLSIAADLMVEDEEKARILLTYDYNQLSFNENLNVSIISNDLEASFSAGSGELVLADGDKQTIDFPFKGYYEDQKTQCLFTADELREKGLTAGISIQSLALEIKQKYSNKPFKNFNIAIGHTEQNEAHDPGNTFIDEALTTVYTSDYTTNNGWNEFVFDQSFTWDGSANLVVQFCFDNKQWSNNDVVLTEDVGFFCTQLDYKDSNRGCGLSKIRKKSTLRPNMKWGTGSEGDQICEDIFYKQSSVEAKQMVVFRDEDLSLAGMLLAGNQSDGCVDLSIDQKGNKLTKANWNNAVDRIQKSFYYEQDHAESNELKLYFSQNDLSMVDLSKDFYLVESAEPIATSIEANHIHKDHFEWNIVNGGALEVIVQVSSNAAYTIALDDNLGAKLTTRAKANNLDNVNIYPNPFENSLQFDFDQAVDTQKEINVIDQSGKIVQTVQVDEGQQIYLMTMHQDLPAGPYYIQIVLPDGAKWMKRALKI